MNRANLSQLAVLATVAQCASFRGAARELGIAPSAVSHAVSNAMSCTVVSSGRPTRSSPGCTRPGSTLYSPVCDPTVQA